MPNQIQITSITGTSPYDVYVCDYTNTFCFLVTGATVMPPYVTFDVPPPLANVSPIIVKLIDSNGCEFFEPFQCPTPTPTATPNCLVNQYQIWVGGACTFNLYNCSGAITGTYTTTSGGTYNVCSSLPPTSVGTCPYGPVIFLGPCPTVTPTPTPTPSPTPLLDCTIFSLYFDFLNYIESYDLVSNTSSGSLSFPGFPGGTGSGSGIANTNNRFWISQVDNFTSITEYNLVISPFNATFSRTIDITGFTPSRITAIDNNTLIANDSLSDDIYELDITTSPAVSTYLFSITGSLSGNSINGINITTSGKLFVWGIASPHSLQQYSYPSGTLEVDQSYTFSAGTPYAVVQNSGRLYVLTSQSDVYELQTSSPYNLTYTQTDTMPFGPSSQAYGCVTLNLIP